MIIYHLFLNGQYQFKTNSFEEVYEQISSLVHHDLVISDLIEKHVYRLYDYNGNRKIDIMTSQVGFPIV